MKLFIPGAGGKVFHILNFREVKGVERVIISELDAWAYGNVVADASYQLPRFTDSDFFPAFEKVYKLEKFDVCIPINDSSLYVFSENRELLRSFPFYLAMNPKETIDLVADKIATYEFFVANDIPTADVFTIERFLSLGEYSFPYYVKPRYIYLRGTKKQLYMKIEDRYDIEYVCRKIRGNEREFVIQEYLEGTEINIDFFCDGKGEVKSIVPLKRLGMGVSRGITRGEIISDRRFDPYVIKTARAIKLWGANNMQVYVNPKGDLKFTEINGRFSGSSILVKEAGVNFFHYFINLLKGEEIEINEEPKCLKMSSWENPYFFTDGNIRKLQ